MLSTNLVSLSFLLPDLPHFSNPPRGDHYHKFAVVNYTSVHFIPQLPSPCIHSPCHILSTDRQRGRDPGVRQLRFKSQL